MTIIIMTTIITMIMTITMMKATTMIVARVKKRTNPMKPKVKNLV